MTSQRYSIKESLNRILRLLIGEPTPQDTPGTVTGNIDSEDEAMSQLAELLADSLPGETLTLPTAAKTAVSNAGFIRGGWAGGKDFYVNKDHASASDTNTGLDSSKPLATIQRAITLASPMNGDVIHVLQNDGWEYGSGFSDTITEAVTVPATKPGLRIVGDGAGSMGVNWTAGVTGTFCLTINAIDTIVDGFNFWGEPVSCHGIYCDWNGVTAYGENSIIQNCTFTDTIDIGIQLEFSWYANITGNHFQECDGYGIYVDPAGDGIAYSQILGNWFHDCAHAMALDDCDDSLIANNMVYNEEALVTGSAINLGLNTSSGSGNMVANNYFSCLLANWDNFNTSSATDSWVNNHVIDGNPTARPA